MALSTTEAEYMTTFEASKEILWLRGLIGTFGIIHDTIQVYCDSQSSIYLAKDCMYHKRKKYINVRYHRIRHWVVLENAIDLVKISTKKNPVDMMTDYSDVEVQRLSELHQYSLKVRWRVSS